MPIYEYRCPACEHEFEELVSLGAAAPPCPSCGQGTERLMSGTQIGRKSTYSKKMLEHDAKRSAEKAKAATKK